MPSAMCAHNITGEFVAFPKFPFTSIAIALPKPPIRFSNFCTAFLVDSYFSKTPQEYRNYETKNHERKHKIFSV